MLPYTLQYYIQYTVHMAGNGDLQMVRTITKAAVKPSSRHTQLALSAHIHTRSCISADGQSNDKAPANQSIT